MAVDLDQQLARLPGALQGLQDRAVAEAVRQATDLVSEHLGDRHRVEHLFVVLDGGGSQLATGQKANLHLAWSYEIVGWTLLADTTGSLTVDLRVAASYAAYPTVASICAAAPPSLTAAQKNDSDALPMTGWTTLLSAGQVLRPFVSSASGINLATLTLRLRPV
jgi:hypothetical protein